MTTTIGELSYKLGVDATAFQKGMQDAHSQAESSGGFMRRALEFATGGAILNGLTAVKDSVLGVAGSMVEGNAEFETYQTQFGVLLGSTDEAKKRLDDLAKFGASTPFDLPELVKADKILTGFGIHSEEMLTIVGDVSAGTGQSFEDMALLMGKFSAGATGEVISRFAELGITNRKQLAELGLQFSKSGELLSPLPEAMAVVQKLMKDKYGGMMDAQSQTFEGMMSNLEDWKGSTIRTLGQPIFEVVKDKLGVVLEFLGSPQVKESVNTFANILAGSIASGIDALENFLIAAKPVFDFLVTNVPVAIGAAANAWNTVLYPALQMIWTFIENNVKPILAALVAVLIQVVVPAFLTWASTAAAAAVTTITALAPVLLPLAAIGAAVFVLYKAWDSNFLGIREALTNFWFTYGVPIFNTLKAWLAENLPIALQRLSDFWNNILLPALKAIWAFIQNYVMPILSTLVSVHFAVLQAGITTLAGFWNGTLLPALNATWSFINTYVIPVVKALYDVHMAALGAAARTVAGFWKDTLLPALTSIKSYVTDTLIPAFEKFTGPIVGAVSTAFGAIAKTWKDTLSPAFEAIKTYVGITLGPALSTFGGIVSSITGFFDTMGDKVSAVVGYLKDLKEWLDAIGNPSIPSKPKQNSTESITAPSSTSFRTSSLGGNNTAGVTNNYNLSVTTAATSQGVIDNFAHMAAKARV